MPKLRSGSLGALTIALLIAAASAWLSLNANAIFCERLPSMTILATLSAFVMALCFRLFPRAAMPMHKWMLASALIVAAGTLFADARFVIKYRGVCSQLEKQIRQINPPAPK
jgi:hypothetical protein